MSAVNFIWEIFETVKVILLYGWPFIILLWLIIMRQLWKAWPVDVIIIEKRGSNLIKTNDRAGKYIDSYTGMTGYRLQKAKDTIPIVNYDWVLHNVPVHNTIFDRLVNLIRGNIGTLFLFRYGAKQYKPINITENSEAKVELEEIKDAEGNPIIVPRYQQLDPRGTLDVLNFDVIDWDNMNFMVQEQRASMVRRTKKSEYWKGIILPLGALAVTALVCLLMLKFSYDWASGMAAKSSTNTNPSSPAEVPDIPVISDIIPAT